MYEWNEDEKKIDFSHNPFSMPNFDHEAFLALDPTDKDTILGIKAFQYDIVCNGIELSSGAIRNHRPDIMRKAFEIAGYGEDVLEEKFGGMLRALTLRRPAARRHRAGHRPHRHAALRRAEPARGRALPDEPAGRGPAHGRARRGDAEAAARAAYPAEPAREGPEPAAPGPSPHGGGRVPSGRRDSARMNVVLRPAEALARAVERLAAQGFAVVARNTRGDSVYLKPEACAFALRVSNHARTAKQRKNHPDAITSLVLRDPTSEAALAEAVAVAVRNFAGERAKRERGMGANGPSQA